MTSGLLAILFRKWKVKDMDAIDLKVVAQINREHGVHESELHDIQILHIVWCL